MKLLFVDNSLRMLVNFRIDVAAYYHSLGHDVMVCYPTATHDESLFRMIPDGIRVFRISCDPSSISPLKDIRYFLALYRLYGNERPDFIFHYTIKPNIYGTFAARLLRLRCIDVVAGLGYIFSVSGLKGTIGRMLYRLALQRADKVITLNEEIRHTLVKEGFVKQGRMVLFEGGEGVNLERFSYARNEFRETRFLMVARILYDKGYKEYVEAAAIVRQHHPDIKIELLGPMDEVSPMGVPESVLRADVAAGLIDYLGVTNDVPGFLKRDGVVVVVSSYHEGLNRSLMEACAMARPVITTNIPGCRETVDEGINGFMVPAKNGKALAEAMLRFIALPQADKIRMAEASYQKALSTFNLRLVLKRYDDILNGLSSR